MLNASEFAVVSGLVTHCLLLLERKCALLGITVKRATELPSCLHALPHLPLAICHLGIILQS